MWANAQCNCRVDPLQIWGEYIQPTPTKFGGHIDRMIT